MGDMRCRESSLLGKTEWLARGAHDALLADLALVLRIKQSTSPTAGAEIDTVLTSCLEFAEAPAEDLAALWILTGLLASKQKPIPEARSRRFLSLAR